jgi:cob(I)alamin adenosyltransferase
LLLAVERDLYELMAELAAAGDSNSPFAGQVTVSDVTQLEDWLAEFEGQVEMPSDFVIPGDSPAGAGLHLARTIVRRAERLAVRLADDGLLGNEQVLRYLNRLSSLLYVLALFEDSIARDGHLTLAKEG